MSILETAQSALAERLGDTGFDGSVKFEIDGVGALRIDEGGVSISDEDADCTLAADADIFEEML